MSDRTRKSAEATIEHLAKDAFADHELTPSKETPGAWRCGVAGSSLYWFSVLVSPGYAFIFGDIGDFVLRHSDPSGLHWLLTAGSRDYVLGKVSASGEPKREFMLGDALDTLDERRKELDADAIDCCHNCAFDVDASAGKTACPDCGGPLERCDPDSGKPVAEGKAAKRIDTVRARFKERRDEMEPDGHAWAGAWYDVGECEPPRCEFWSPGCLWLWEAIKTFRRLHAAQQPAVPSAGWRPQDQSSAPEPQP